MSMVFNRKAQAAVEFLTTYGWAFLVILIMISALAYFGILSPSKFLPNRCNFGAEFQCVDYQLSSVAPFISMKLKNNVGQAITISNIKMEAETGTLANCASVPAIPFNMLSGTIDDITFSAVACGTDLTAVGIVKGEKGKVLVTIDYFSLISGAGYRKQAKGEILATMI